MADAGSGALPGCFELLVDEGGAFVVAVGAELSIGHARSPESDLAFLADVGGVHAHLRRSESLRGGPTWRLRSAGGEALRVNGESVGEDGAELRPGDVAVLAANLSFRFVAPDPASDTFVLEGLGGTACAGARRIVLLGPGRAGALRIGPRRRHHVAVAEAPAEVTLELDGSRVRVSSDAGLRDPAADGAGRRDSIDLELPIARRLDLWVGERAPDAPPFVVSVGPLRRGIPE